MLYRLLAMLAILVTVSGCGDDNPRAMDGSDERLAALETRLQALEERHDKDIQALRNDLRSILTYFETAIGNLQSGETVPRPDEGLGESARETFDKAMERLRQTARDMLNRLSRELEREPGASGMGEPDRPTPAPRT